MACCLSTPSHYLNQYWNLNKEVLWHSPDTHFTSSVQDTVLYNWFENHTFKRRARGDVFEWASEYLRWLYHKHHASTYFPIRYLKITLNSIQLCLIHDNDVIMSAKATQITSLNCLFRRSSKKTSKLRVTGLWEGNSPVTSEYPTQRASNAENCIHLMTSLCYVALIPDGEPEVILSHACLTSANRLFMLAARPHIFRSLLPQIPFDIRVTLRWAR